MNVTGISLLFGFSALILIIIAAAIIIFISKFFILSSFRKTSDKWKKMATDMT